MEKTTTKIIKSLTTDRWTDSALLFLRLFIGTMMMTHGLAKLENFNVLEGTFPNTLGMGSYTSLIMIIMVEVGCSALVIAGFLTRLAVLPMIFSMCVAAFMTSPIFTINNSELAIIYLGVFITILISGAGKYSIDLLLRSYKKCK